MTFSTWSSWLAETSSGWPGCLSLIPASLAVLGVFYWLVTTGWIVRRAAPGEGEGSGAAREPGAPGLPPVLFLRPVKRGVPGLADKARRLLDAARPGDAVLFGVDSAEDCAVCEAACASAPPGVRAGVVFWAPPPDRVDRVAGCGGPPRNPKIAKLIAMTEHADWAPGHWILTDSEALPDRRFMDALRVEWAALSARGKAAVLTAGYRFTGASRFPQQFDQFPALLTLWPGLAAAEWGRGRRSRGSEGSKESKESGGLGFALGACIAITKSDVARVGGWEAFADSLVEDNKLGVALAAQGRATRLSREILTLDADPTGWCDWLLHQHRVVFTYRACNPGGAFAMLFTHGVTWALLAALLAGPGVGAAWIFFAAVAALRIATARRSARALRFFDKMPLWRFGLSVLAVSLMETVFWLVAWLPLPVRWGGRFLRVDSRGRLLTGSPAPPVSLGGEAVGLYPAQHLTHRPASQTALDLAGTNRD